MTAPTLKLPRNLVALALQCIALFSLASAAAPVGAAPSADAALKALYTREWAWRVEQFDDDEEKNGGVAARLPDISPAAQAARLAYWNGVLAELDRIRPETLSPEARVDYGIYRYQIGTLAAAQRFRDYEMPFNSDSSFWGDIAYTAERPFKTAQQYRNWIAQMNALPRYFAQAEANMRAGLARGFTPPRVTLEGRDKSVAAIAEARAPQDTVFYKPFKAMPPSIPTAEAEALRAEGAAVIAAKVIPAYRQLLAFLERDYIPGARTTLAATSLPDGPAYYQSKIAEYATVALTPDQIHAIGLEQVALIRAQMEAVMRETGFNGDLPAFLRFLKTDQQFYVTRPEALLERAAWIAKEFDGKAPAWFGRNPRARFGIKPVPPEIAPFYTAGRGGTYTYWLNTWDLPSRPLYALPALTLHESAPGHSWQTALALENKARPDFRRKTYISAFGEGWALYTEKLGAEMGMYATPYERFGMLSYQMWRAVRLVVDTGIHAKGWTRAQAQAFLRDNTALSEQEVTTEIDRYISWPAQALSYYLGQMAIEAGRAKAEKALGPKFNIRAFHDMVLAQGSVPLPVLETQIDAFIAGGGIGPYPDEEK